MYDTTACGAGWLSARSLTCLLPLKNGGYLFVGCSCTYLVYGVVAVGALRSVRSKSILFCLRCFYILYGWSDPFEHVCIIDGAEMPPDYGELPKLKNSSNDFCLVVISRRTGIIASCVFVFFLAFFSTLVALQSR